MKLARLVTLATLACTALPAHADGVVRGVVEVTRGKDVPPGAVLVYVVGFTEAAPSTPVVVKQVNKKFLPDLIVMTAGGTVSFPNGDPFLHNVFSPTSDRVFDVGSYRQNETRTRTFPKPGVIDIFCNIHPEMSATLVVLPNTKHALVDANGQFEIKGLPAGTWTVFAYSRRAERPTSTKVVITDGATSEIKLSLNEVPRDFKHRNKYGEEYRPSAIYNPGDAR
jgi:plastocyanin